MEQLETVFEAEINPVLKQHGGLAHIVELRDGTLTIRLSGSCQTCLQRYSTADDFIKTIVQKAFPEITEVVIVDGVSPELWQMAMKVLHKEKSAAPGDH